MLYPLQGETGRENLAQSCLVQPAGRLRSGVGVVEVRKEQLESARLEQAQHLAVIGAQVALAQAVGAPDIQREVIGSGQKAQVRHGALMEEIGKASCRERV